MNPPPTVIQYLRLHLSRRNPNDKGAPVLTIFMTCYFTHMIHTSGLLLVFYILHNCIYILGLGFLGWMREVDLYYTRKLEL